VGVVGEQARVAMRNLETALAAAGCSLADVVKSTVYVASDRRADLVEAWPVVTEAFGDHEPESRKNSADSQDTAGAVRLMSSSAAAGDPRRLRRLSTFSASPLEAPDA
jgi:enamine deaminase RidA (YjgF/YER057c/UK114 family)